MKSVDALMRRAVAENCFPGAQLLVSHAGHILFHRSYGFANIYTGQKITPDTFFDLASLTKPLATTLAIMKLVQAGRIVLEQTLAATLPSLDKTRMAGIRICDLLYHTSGLPDYRQYYLDLKELSYDRRKDSLHDMLVAESLVYETGKKSIYSDIGFMFLEWLIEHVSGTGLDSFVREQIYDPMGIADLFYVAHRQQIPDKKFAATEICPWRNILISGLVHDDNAYVMGGVAGHAGLFGTASAVHILLTELLNVFHNSISAKTVFSSDLVRLFLTRGPNRDRALGFDLPSPGHSSSGDGFSKDWSVGHLGFTGTSFWMDLKQQIIVILLTNRIHPSRSNDRIKKFRPMIHNEVMSQLTRRV